MEKNLQTIEDVQEFLNDCVNYLGLAFHPDTNFSDYVSSNGYPLYNEEQAEISNQMMEKSFDICDELDVDIYEMTLNLL
jgi:hypothetical protein